MSYCSGLAVDGPLKGVDVAWPEDHFTVQVRERTLATAGDWRSPDQHVTRPVRYKFDEYTRRWHVCPTES